MNKIIWVLEKGSALKPVTFTRYDVLEEKANSYTVDNAAPCIGGIHCSQLRRVAKGDLTFTDKATAFLAAREELQRQKDILYKSITRYSSAIKDVDIALSSMFPISYQIVHIRKDDDGHTYLVPAAVVEQFDKAQEAIWTANGWDGNAVNYFCEQFDQYRKSGGVGNMKFMVIE